MWFTAHACDDNGITMPNNNTPEQIKIREIVNKLIEEVKSKK